MQGRKFLAPKMYYQVNLDSLVKPDNFYRKLNEVLDLYFLLGCTPFLHYDLDEALPWHSTIS